MGIISGITTLFKLLSLIKTIWDTLRAMQAAFAQKARDEAHKKVDAATDVLESPSATEKEKQDAIKRIANNSF